jgi:Tol biopolymer transport system component
MAAGKGARVRYFYVPGGLMRRFPTFSSHGFVSLALMLGATIVNINPASAQQLTLISAASDGTQGTGGDSFEPVISGDGRFVAFTSSATNLVPNDTNAVADVFVKDRVSGAIERVSVRTTGEQGTLPSNAPRISADGRFVAFDSAGPLVAEDTNTCGQPAGPCSDTYIHDRMTHTTTRVSVSSTGAEAAEGSTILSLSADGRFVLFRSLASTLVANDTNNASDLFLRDRQNATTTRVSVDLSGNQLPNHTSAGMISGDGQVIVYSVQRGADQAWELYLRNRETGEVSDLTASLPARNLPPHIDPAGYHPFYVAASHISDDGRVIAVVEGAAARTVHRPFPGIVRYLMHDRVTGHTLVSAWQETINPFNGFITGLSGDGRTYVGTEQYSTPVQLIDRVSGLRETIPTATGSEYKSMSLSSDGRFTAFGPYDGTVGASQQLYVYDRDSGDADGMPSAWETAFGLNPTDLTDANADADLDGVTNLQEYVRGTHPAALASATRYFAEGASNAFFTTRIAAVNPGNDTATVVFRFLGSSGATSSLIRTIPARTRITVELPGNGPTPGNDYSTVLESDRMVVADRTMTWDSTGYGSHTETALPAPSTTWHFAEGATHGGFGLFYLLQNPNATQAHVTINYLRLAPLTPVVKTYTVEPNTRMTIPVDLEGPELDEVDVAAAITSDLPIVAERSMYSVRIGQPAFAAGHGGAGVTAPASRWFLAEGATGNFFDVFVLVGNPNLTASELKVTYLLPTGAPIEKLHSVGPQQRLTINVQQEDVRLANTPVSVIVESTNSQPVVVERAMWWPKDEWHEALVSAGATPAGTKWALADGEVTVGGDTYILIANTSTTAGTATLTLLEEGGTPLAIAIDLLPSSRVSVPISAYLPPTVELPRRRFGALIETTGVEIVVERSIYTTVGGITWGAGSASLGTKLQ